MYDWWKRGKRTSIFSTKPWIWCWGSPGEEEQSEMWVLENKGTRLLAFCLHSRCPRKHTRLASSSARRSRADAESSPSDEAVDNRRSLTSKSFRSSGLYSFLTDLGSRVQLLHSGVCRTLLTRMISTFYCRKDLIDVYWER